MGKILKRILTAFLVIFVLAFLAWLLSYMYDSIPVLQTLFGSSSGNQAGLRVPTDDPGKVELFMPVFGGKISLFIFTFIIFLQIFAVVMAAHVVKKIVKSNYNAAYKLARFKNADTFLDLPLYIGLFGSVSSFLLISFSPQSSRLVAYSSTLIGIIFSVIARLGILYPAKEKIISDAASEKLEINE
ncbi:MAG: hypothetical protein IKB71_07885 [Lentisphaeria bacterium]|nr:hypothetical protein [Lentisphaeria bacterium]